jgi:RNA polymerase sigma factor (sigma-70 family)
MAMEISRFERLMRDVLQGSEQARRELVEVYGEHILRIVRRKLHMPLRRQFDSADFAQAVWASFFAASHERTAIRTPEELGHYLAKMAQNKVAEAFRNRLQTQKNDLNRERSLDELGAGTFEASDPRQATPSQFAIADEKWERLLVGLNPTAQKVLMLLRSGYSHKEVSAMTGIHVKAIQRLVRKAKENVQP